MYSDIPAHTNCIGCGDCCGLVPVNQAELERIRGYLKDRVSLRALASQNQCSAPERCPFRSDEHKNCMIYPVRPLICRLMGVTAIMPCKHGNSANINPSILAATRKKSDAIFILNQERF